MSGLNKATKKANKKPSVVVVTGLSGAGLTAALHVFQDNGFYCIDNLPVVLLDRIIDFVLERKESHVGYAFGMDLRDKRFAAEFPVLKNRLKEQVNLDVVFLCADEAVLVDRYGSTRRLHPLMSTSKSILQAIRAEERVLRPVRSAADTVLDTSLWSPQMLQHSLETRYKNIGISRILYVTISSFGFKHGILRPAENIFDIRFLNNPYFVPALKDLTGKDKAVFDFIFSDTLSRETFKRMEAWFRFLLPKYFVEGKHFLRIGIGCTGGKHRSVAFAEKLGSVLNDRPVKGTSVCVVHRDIDL